MGNIFQELLNGFAQLRVEVMVGHFHSVQPLVNLTKLLDIKSGFETHQNYCFQIKIERTVLELIHLIQ